jgi:site-specific DNA-methyltransferase (adenine-specific)
MANAPYMPQSKSQEYQTPDWLFAALDKEFYFTLDAAASDSNALCEKYYTKEANGLVVSWGLESVYINPPYEVKTLTAFAKKAYEEARADCCTTVVMLVPVKSDQAWWHDYALKSEIRYIKGRIKFKGQKGTFPGPLAVLVFDQDYLPGNRSMLRDGTCV